MIRAALIQLTATEEPSENLAKCEQMVLEAARGGAQFVATPEVSNCIAASRTKLAEVLHFEADDPFLRTMRELARAQSIWLLLGSIGVKSEETEGKYANRSILIAPDGNITARYDKIHMFDVDISETESYRESNTYQRGNRAVLGETDFGKIGMTICYDLRFGHLHRALSKAGASILTVPAAFAVPTGEAHWETLLRARAIENGAFVIAPAQTGLHYSKNGKERRTYGHSMVIDPWGEILLDAGVDECVSFVDLDLDLVEKTRRRVGSLTQLSEFSGPE